MANDAYPESWKPRQIKAREKADAKRADEAAEYLGALNDDQIAALIARIRPAND